MGAGMGKSRVAAALAFHILTTTKKEVYLVFSDQGLLNRDKD
jgi:septum formation inhibitor-activating ATPase MinD